MLFTYKIYNVKDYCRDNCIKTYVPSLVGLLIVLFSIYISLDYEQKLFVILLTSALSFLSLVLAILLSYNNWKKEYLSFSIIIENEIITIKNNSSIKNNNISQIKNIYCDKNGNYYIKYSLFNKNKILKYIENKMELENILLKIKPIEKYKNYSKIIHYIPSLFFVGIVLINNFKNIYLYIIFAFCLIISSVFSSVLVILEGDNKKRVIIGNLLINTFFVIFFIIILIYTINYLRG
jgi:hypothetical protein